MSKTKINLLPITYPEVILIHILVRSAGGRLTRRTAMSNDTTIGLDLGNKKHEVVGLDGRGKIILKCELSSDKETLGAFFKEHAGATVAMETGTHCRWISSLARHCGYDAIDSDAFRSVE